MNRRHTVLAVFFVSCTLMACTCGGVPPRNQQSKPTPVPAEIDNIKAEPVASPVLKQFPSKPSVPPLPAAPTVEQVIARFGKPNEDWGNDRISSRPTQADLFRNIVYKTEGITFVYAAKDYQFPVRVWAFKEFKGGKSHGDALVSLAGRDNEKASIEAAHDAACQQVTVENEKAVRQYALAVKAAEEKAAGLRQAALAKLQDDERKKREVEIEAKRQAEIAEANRPRPNRENYNKLRDGMTLEEVQRDILGPGRETASGGGIQYVSWTGGSTFSRDRFTSITCTFRNGILIARAIFD